MNIFHVHTFRCGHAENIPDEAYVKKAIELGADEIWFTDHAPFPGDPFGSRMNYDELEEYLDTLSSLKKKHTDIAIHIGLEAEYFPHFDADGYYNICVLCRSWRCSCWDNIWHKFRMILWSILFRQVRSS